MSLRVVGELRLAYYHQKLYLDQSNLDDDDDDHRDACYKEDEIVIVNH